MTGAVPSPSVPPESQTRPVQELGQELTSPNYQDRSLDAKTQNEGVVALIPSPSLIFLLKAVIYHQFSFIFIARPGP